MIQIFKNLVPYWKTILVIFALLIVQAFCDLSLPQYTSDIIDVGIQNSGVEHVLPENITNEEFETVKSLAESKADDFFANKMVVFSGDSWSQGTYESRSKVYRTVFAA